MEPSACMISQITPAGNAPASFARSTAASVCPARFSTPPSWARSGNTCPGIPKSSGFEEGSVTAFTVAARSCALVPVVVPVRASIDTANAVSWCAASCAVTIRGMLSSSRRQPAQGMHTIPRPCVTMKLMASGVTASAAITKSPSFSRSASSTTITILPSAMSAIASSIESNTARSTSASLIETPPAAPRTSRSRRLPG